jgi:hypothetical protein
MPVTSIAARGARVFATLAVLAAMAVVTAPEAGASADAPAAATAGSLGGAARPHGPLTTAQALARAAASHRPVPVPGATTPTDTLTANPNGTLTLTESLVPVRKRVGGAWQPLTARLLRGPGGIVSASTTTTALRLSDGGTGPLATMRTAAGQSLSVWLPVRLPVPVLSGDTALYQGVLPGVDLRVTADPQGGFSEVLVVKDAAAAANPLLRHLVLATRTQGVRLAAGRATSPRTTPAAGRSSPRRRRSCGTRRPRRPAPTGSPALPPAARPTRAAACRWPPPPPGRARVPAPARSACG